MSAEVIEFPDLFHWIITKQRCACGHKQTSICPFESDDWDAMECGKCGAMTARITHVADVDWDAIDDDGTEGRFIGWVPRRPTLRIVDNSGDTESCDTPESVAGLMRTFIRLRLVE
jgi:hypothetical protein